MHHHYSIFYNDATKDLWLYTLRLAACYLLLNVTSGSFICDCILENRPYDHKY